LDEKPLQMDEILKKMKINPENNQKQLLKKRKRRLNDKLAPNCIFNC
jgi:rRNA pseudouridine-1189 N-methylase Emg1 (Nep1/Mra1 family)